MNFIFVSAFVVDVLITRISSHLQAVWHYNLHFYSFITTIITVALKILKFGAGVGPISLNKRSSTKVQGGKGHATCNTTKED
jgi:hypothetical protein